MEDWKTIHDHPDYEVTSDGKVRRVYAPGVTRRVKPHLRMGAPHVWLRGDLLSTKKRKQHRLAIARLVLSTFGSPPPSRKHMAVHRDNDPANIKLENLIWMTAADVFERRERSVMNGTPLTKRCWRCGRVSWPKPEQSYAFAVGVLAFSLRAKS